MGTEEGLNRYDGYTFKTYRHENNDSGSLSNNYIWSICEDKAGFIWIGTDQGGLDKFNPKLETFVHYKVNDDDPASLSNNSVQCVYADRAGNIWAGTWGGGLNKYNRNKNNFTWYQHDSLDSGSLSNDEIFTIYEDSKGYLWIGTDGGGASVLETASGRFVSYRHDPDNPNSLCGNTVLSIFEDGNGKIWLGTYGQGLSVFDPGENKFSTFKYSENGSSISQNIIWSIHQDRQGLIWLGTLSNGITIYDPVKDKFTRLHHDPLSPVSISSDYIKNMFEDRSGVLWFGTVAGGVNLIDRKPEKFHHFKYDPKKPDGISSSSIYSILEDSNGDIWFGGDKHILNRYNSKSHTFTKYYSNPDNPKSLNGEIIRCLSEDSHGDLWVGTYFGSLQKYDRRTDSFIRMDLSGLESENPNVVNIRSIFEDSKGILWFATNGGGLLEYDRDTKKFRRFSASSELKLSNDNIISVCEDPDGYFWIGTYGGGLNKLDVKNEKITYYRNDPRNPHSLNDDIITDLYFSSDGILWAGTYLGGLNKYEKATDSFKHFTDQEGMASNIICDIIEDKQGMLWLSTYKGITKFNPLTNSIKNYDYNDGAPGEYNPGAGFETKNGMIYFGGFNEVTYFDPQNMAENTKIPSVSLTSFKKFNKEFKLSRNPAYIDTIVLSYDDIFFSFEFSSLDFTFVPKNKYAYMLEGFDKSWVYPGNRNIAMYTNIDPGEYTFKVKGSNDDGIWNTKGASVAIIIQPPFWKTWWFRGLLLAGFLGAAGFVYKRRISKLEKEGEIQEEFSHRLIHSQEEERKRIASELHDSLGQNLLIIKNRAAMGLRSGADEIKSRQLEEISEGASAAIDEVRRISYNLHPYHLDRLGLTKAIRSIIDNLDAASSLNFNLKCDNVDGLLKKEDEIGLFRIVQECINNIIKHSDASEAEIEIIRTNGRIDISIGDNGRGFNSEEYQASADPAKGFGIRNLQKRVNILNGNIIIRSANQKGTNIIINIPLDYE